MDNDATIVTDGLGYRFGRKWAVRDLTLTVPRGSVTAFLGLNGAGKTTTIRMLLGLLPVPQGSARVLGIDVKKQPARVRQRVGYVAEEKPLYDWMRVGKILKFVSAFYPTWDSAEAERLIAKLKLPLREKIKNLSRGMRGQLALVLALAHRPELLIFDEPTAGLDIKVRKDFLEGLIDLIHVERRTAFLSSHQIEDVERVADRVVFIKEGRLVAEGALEELKGRVRRVRLVLSGEGDPPSELPGGWRQTGRSGRSIELIADPFREEDLVAIASGVPLAGDPEVEPPSLEDLFMHYAALEGEGEK